MSKYQDILIRVLLKELSPNQAILVFLLQKCTIKFTIISCIVTIRGIFSEAWFEIFMPMNCPINEGCKSWCNPNWTGAQSDLLLYKFAYKIQTVYTEHFKLLMFYKLLDSIQRQTVFEFGLTATLTIKSSFLILWSFPVGGDAIL